MTDRLLDDFPLGPPQGYLMMERPLWGEGKSDGGRINPRDTPRSGLLVPTLRVSRYPAEPGAKELARRTAGTRRAGRMSSDLR